MNYNNDGSTYYFDKDHREGIDHFEVVDPNKVFIVVCNLKDASNDFIGVFLIKVDYTEDRYKDLRSIPIIVVMDVDNFIFLFEKIFKDIGQGTV